MAFMSLRMVTRRVFNSLRLPCASITPSASLKKEFGRAKTFHSSSDLGRAASDKKARGISGMSASASQMGQYNKVIDTFENDAPLINSWGNNTLMKSSSVSSNGRIVSVRWSDGEKQDYSSIWLRDNCHCVDCCDQEAFTRNIYLTEISLEIRVHYSSLLADGQVLSVEWDDGHHGIFPTDWLRGHRFDQSHPDPIEGARPHLWGYDVMLTPHFRQFGFDEVMESDDALYGWLKVLYNLGIAILKNAPTDQGQQYRLQKRLGYDSPAPSSSGILNQAKLHLKNNHPLYTEKRLQLHTDLSYYTQPKGFQLFHCIQQVSGEGGDSLLVDGFKVAQDLKSQNPDAFRVLTRVHWEYKLIFDKNYHIARHKVLRLDDDGEVCQVTVNDICRTAMLRIPPRDVHKAYSALSEFTNMLYHPANLLLYKLEPGDILAFHNHRVLHGRQGFDLHSDTKRHLETCYSDWEIVSARMRTLKKQQILSYDKPYAL